MLKTVTIFKGETSKRIKFADMPEGFRDGFSVMVAYAADAYAMGGLYFESRQFKPEAIQARFAELLEAGRIKFEAQS